MSASSGDTAASAPQARPTPTGSSGFFLDLLRAFIRGNGFYVLSMVLVVFGCHHHVHTTVTTGAGAEFSRTLLSLTVLQAYELLVIATAALVVRRLRILGDAGTLLLIEAALLLDPTFFANSFLTMPGQKGLLVNAVCLALVPLKLLVLQSLIGVRMSGRLGAAFVAAAAVVYLAPWPLDRRDMPFLSLYGYYYLVGTMTALVAVILPPAASGLQAGRPGLSPAGGSGEEFVSPSQRRWLPRVLIALPLLITAAHYFETARVYTLAFYPANAAPLLLAGAAVAVANGQRGRSERRRRLLVDGLAAAALLLSLQVVNVPSRYDLMRPEWALPDFIRSPWPLLIAATGVAGLYVYYWLYLRDPAAVRRLVVMAAGGAFLGIWKAGLPGAVLSALQGGGRVVAGGVGALLHGIGNGIAWGLSLFAGALRWVCLLMLAHPDATLVVLLVVALWISRRFPGFGNWFVAGLLGLLVVFRQLPGGFLIHGAEFVEAVIILALALSHRFHPVEERGPRVAGAVMVCLIASFRLYFFPGYETAGVMLFLIVLLLAAGRLLPERAYLVLGALQFAFCLVLLTLYVRLHVQPALVMVTVGLALFALAVYVTFHKERLLERLQPGPESPLPPPSDAPGTE